MRVMRQVSLFALFTPIRRSSATGSYTLHPSSVNFSRQLNANSLPSLASGNANNCSFSNTVRLEWFSCLCANRRFRMSLQKISIPYEFSPLELTPPTFSMRLTAPSGQSTTMTGSLSVAGCERKCNR
uniref:Putative secreted protein n=1 Tax=Anopheles darlingi TaxID=43151 RepID=A0A2M4DE98_ANODA